MASSGTTWERVRFGDLARIAHGWPFKSEAFTEARSGRPIVVSIGNFQYTGGFRFESTAVKEYASDYPKEYELSPGDVLLVMTCQTSGGEILGIPGRIPDDGNTYLHNQRMGKVVVKDPKRFDLVFAYYLALWSDFNRELYVSASGTKILHTAPRRIEAFEFDLPPLAEQKAIAALLGALDDKIELNRRMNTTLEAMARVLFQSWFVDFDPVRAKLDDREPSGVDSNTAALFPNGFEHGEQDLLPLGWYRAAIEELCAVNAWTLSKSDSFQALEYVEISEVSRGDIFNIPIYIRGQEPSRARRRLRDGDTVLSTVRPDRGSYFLALNTPENRVASTGFAVLTPTKAPWAYIHAALTQTDVFDHLGQMADGGAYPAVRPDIIGAMTVALPDNPKILEAFQSMCAPLFVRADANRAQSRTLANLRDTLLPKLLSGELRVPADSVIRNSRITAIGGTDRGKAPKVRRKAAP